MNNKYSGPVHILRVAARTAFSLRPKANFLCFFFASAVLCLTDLGLGRMSLGVCLLGACDNSGLTACVLGILAGNLSFFGLRAAAAPCAVAAAVLCARRLIPKRMQRYAVPSVAAGISAIVGLPSLLESGFAEAAAVYQACLIAMTAGGIVLFRAALTQSNTPVKIAALCALLPGLSAIRLPGGWSAAVFALAWAVCASTGLIYACAGCAVLSALYPQSAPCYAALCLGALIFRLLRSKAPPACGAACLVYLLNGFQTRSFGFSACASAGTALALLLSPERFLPAPRRTQPARFPARRELRSAAKAMKQAADMLRVPEVDPHREMSAIIDAAAGSVCRNCAKHRTCRSVESHPESDLTKNAAIILAKGAAALQDFPPQFQEQCIHQKAFLTAVNDAIDDDRAGQRIRRRLREARDAAQAQYTLMSSLLSRLSEQLYAPDSTVNFTPDISVQAIGRGGKPVSGDRGASFAGPGATHYVLLCDGMGTGEAAARESRRAVELLHMLLLSGAEAESALCALNGIYLLRDNGCFSTVDLLRINLTSGNAILYKWGGSASYLKRGRGLRQLGGATLPPGLDPADTPERIHLNLDRVGVLVLLSDGLSGKETAQRLRHCDSLDPRDVARSLFAGRAPGADDCTAVCIRLRRTSLREPVAI